MKKPKKKFHGKPPSPEALAILALHPPFTEDILQAVRTHTDLQDLMDKCAPLMDEEQFGSVFKVDGDGDVVDFDPATKTMKKTGQKAPQKPKTKPKKKPEKGGKK